jgi:hypothetical protein
MGRERVVEDHPTGWVTRLDRPTRRIPNHPFLGDDGGPWTRTGTWMPIWSST